jgi:ketosteroid isomerase-like protein
MLCYIAAMRWIIPVFFLSAGVGLRAEDARSADEKVLRGLIEKEIKGERLPYTAYTEDTVFWSGAYHRPLEGRKHMEAVRKGRRAASKRTNERRTRDVKKLVMAQSSDLAYEYSDYTLEFDEPDGRRFHVKGSYVRVWRKEDGQWKVALWFGQPHEDATRR